MKQQENHKEPFSFQGYPLFKFKERTFPSSEILRCPQASIMDYYRLQSPNLFVEINRLSLFHKPYPLDESNAFRGCVSFETRPRNRILIWEDLLSYP